MDEVNEWIILKLNPYAYIYMKTNYFFSKATSFEAFPSQIVVLSLERVSYIGRESGEEGEVLKLAGDHKRSP